MPRGATHINYHRKTVHLHIIAATTTQNQLYCYCTSSPEQDCFSCRNSKIKKTTEYYKATCHNCHLCANVLPDDNNLLILPFLTCHSAITGITSFCAVATVFNNLLYPIISFSFAPFTSFIGTLLLIVICSLFQTLVS